MQIIFHSRKYSVSREHFHHKRLLVIRVHFRPETPNVNVFQMMNYQPIIHFFPDGYFSYFQDFFLKSRKTSQQYRIRSKTQRYLKHFRFETFSTLICYYLTSTCCNTIAQSTKKNNDRESDLFEIVAINDESRAISRLSKKDVK